MRIVGNAEQKFCAVKCCALIACTTSRYISESAQARKASSPCTMGNSKSERTFFLWCFPLIAFHIPAEHLFFFLLLLCVSVTAIPSSSGLSRESLQLQKKYCLLLFHLQLPPWVTLKTKKTHRQRIYKKNNL